MPTYDYKCQECGKEDSRVQTISQYSRAPIRPVCCGTQMERKLSVNPAFSGMANALAGDRHYDGLRATDGTPIDTRTKHREYMKSKGLAMASDFTGTWKQAAKERENIRVGADPERKRAIREDVERAIQQ
jgi:putative FmdB family regulatory protein